MSFKRAAFTNHALISTRKPIPDISHHAQMKMRETALPL